MTFVRQHECWVLSYKCHMMYDCCTSGCCVGVGMTVGLTCQYVMSVSVCHVGVEMSCWCLYDIVMADMMSMGI